MSLVFRKSHSTSHAIISLVEKINNTLNRFRSNFDWGILGMSQMMLQWLFESSTVGQSMIPLQI